VKVRIELEDQATAVKLTPKLVGPLIGCSPKQALWAFIQAYVKGIRLEVPIKLKLGLFRIKRTIIVRIGKARLLKALD